MAFYVRKNMSKSLSAAGLIFAVAVLLPAISGNVSAQTVPPPAGNTDAIIQLNNLTVQSVDASAGVISASGPSGGCLSFNSPQSLRGMPMICPEPPQTAYQIALQADTILLFRTRARAALADFAAGDRINVYGFLDSVTGGVQALIVRDLDKPASFYGYYRQANRLRVVQPPDSSAPPAALTATPQNPCGYRIPCPAASAVSPGLGILYTIRVSAATRVWDVFRNPLPLAAIQSGDLINVYGRYGNGSFDALILRDLNQNGGVPILPPPVPGPGPVISAVSGPTTLAAGQTGTWTVNAVDPNGGVLNYKVVWGDENIFNPYANSGFALPAPVQQSATFTHVYYTPGTYRPTFTVTDQNGGSAQTSLSVIVNGTNPAPSGAVQITSMTPQQGPAGTQVTLSGQNFTPAGNIVHFGSSAYLPNISAAIASDGPGGYVLTFTVPSYSSHACEYAAPRCMIPDYQLQPGVYNVSVENANGTSNQIPFTLTSATGQALQINSIQPQSGAVGAIVTINGSGFTSSGNRVIFGRYLAATADSGDGSTLTFAVPSGMGANCQPNQACPMYFLQTPPGTYAVHVENANGSSNSMSFTVTSSGIY